MFFLCSVGFCDYCAPRSWAHPALGARIARRSVLTDEGLKDAPLPGFFGLWQPKAIIYIYWIMIVFRELANVMYQVCSRFFASPFWRNQLKAKYHPKVLYAFGVSLPSRYTSLPCSWHKVVSQRAWTSRNHSLLAAEDFSFFFKTQGKLSFGRRLLVDSTCCTSVVVPPSVLGPC